MLKCLLCLVFVCGLAACGGGSSGGSSPEPSSTPDVSASPTPSPTPAPDELGFDCSESPLSTDPAPLSEDMLTIDGNQLLINGESTFLKGVVFEVFFPGEAPGSSDPVPDDMPYDCMFAKAAELGVDILYTSFGGVEQMRSDYFEAAARHQINLVMGIWFSGEADNYAGQRGDFQNPVFKTHVRGLISSMIDELYSGLARNYSDQVLYFNIGNELSEWAVNNTNTLHPDITSYEGTYVSTPAQSNATEAFLAEMADYLKNYEQENYGRSRPVSHTTWPVVSPNIVDTSFMDIVSYNIYSHWPAFVSEHAPGSVTETAYQGAIEELANYVSDKPFIVSEFGSSTAPEGILDNVRTELAHAGGFEQQWLDITTGPENVQGAYAFELLDQWHKNDYLHADGNSSPFQHDRTDSEEWFGLIELGGELGAHIYREKPAFTTLRELWQE